MVWFKRVGERLYALDWNVHGKWFVLSGLIGIVAGVGAIAFQVLTQVVMHYGLGQIAGYHPGEPVGEHGIFPHVATSFVPWLIVAVAAVGGLLSGIIVYSLAPEAEGHGTDAAIDAFHNKRGAIKPLIPLVKTIASAITIGTGGSGGREGPIAQIGAGFGSYLAHLLKLTAHDRRIMLAAGMGAGVGAIFRALLVGALFAGEILYSEPDIESDVIVPTAMSSIVAYTVYTLSMPPSIRYMPLFGHELQYSMGSPLELIPYTMLSVILTLFAALYIKVFYGVHKVFYHLPIKRHFRPAIGATLTAIVGLAMYYGFAQDRRALAVLSTGYGTLQEALTLATSVGVPLLLMIVLLAKIVTTSLTISSGGSGGVFGPSMVIGGCVGAAFGLVMHEVWPDVVTQPESYGLVGMAGFFSGEQLMRPISTIIMVSEMTGDYSLLLPTMFCSTLCFVLCRRWKLYTKQVPTRLESGAHRGDFIVDLLEGIKVEEVYRHLDGRMVMIPESMPLKTILQKISTTQQHCFPVVDGESRMVGIFSAEDVRSYLFNDEIWTLAVANDIMVPNVITVTPQSDLNTALKRFTARNIDELPVVAADNPSKLIGMLRRKEVIAFYNRRLVEHKQMEA